MSPVAAHLERARVARQFGHGPFPAPPFPFPPPAKRPAPKPPAPKPPVKTVTSPKVTPTHTTPTTIAKSSSTVSKPASSPPTTARPSPTSTTSVSRTVVPTTSATPRPVSTPTPSSTPTPITTPTTTSAATPGSSANLSAPPSNANTVAAPTISAESTASGTKGSSHTVIVGVVITILVLAALVAAAFFIYRRRLSQRAKTKAWRTSLRAYSDDGAAKNGAGQRQPLMVEKPLAPLPPDLAMPLPPPPAGIPDSFNRPSSISSATPSSIAPSSLVPMYHTALVTPSSPSIGAMNVVVDGAPPMSPAPSSTTSRSKRDKCVVRRTYMPTLPDELSVHMGDRIALVQAFDDGWASCINGRGEQGVVPLECLQPVDEASPDSEEMHDQDGGAWRLSKRASSLCGTSTTTY